MTSRTSDCSEEATMFLLYDNATSPTHSSYLQYNLKLWSGALQIRHGHLSNVLNVLNVISLPVKLSYSYETTQYEQPQVLSPDSHVTFGTIQQTQDAVNVLWVYRHNSRHAAWPTVILGFMETRWKTLALSTQNLNRWIKLTFMDK